MAAVKPKGGKASTEGKENQPPGSKRGRMKVPAEQTSKRGRSDSGSNDDDEEERALANIANRSRARRQKAA